VKIQGGEKIVRHDSGGNPTSKDTGEVPFYLKGGVKEKKGGKKGPRKLQFGGTAGKEGPGPKLSRKKGVIGEKRGVAVIRKGENKENGAEDGFRTAN